MRANELAVLHVQHHIGGFCHCRVVGDDDDAAVIFVSEPVEDLHDVLAVGAVQVARGLVGQDDLAAGGQGAGDGDPLLFAAGEHIGQPLELILLQPHLEELFPCDGICFLAADLADVEGICRVLQDGQVLEQVEVLVDDGHMVETVRVPVDFVGGSPIQIDGAGGGDIQTGQQAEKCGLAAAGAADDGVDQPLLKFTGHPVHRPDGLVCVAVFICNFPCTQYTHF